MDQTNLIKRAATAQARVLAAAEVLSKKFAVALDLKPFNAVQQRDTRVALVLQNEAIAALLEKIAGIEPPAAPEEITHDNSGGASAPQAAIVPPTIEPGKYEEIRYPGAGKVETITVDVLRNKAGEFVSPDDQDADGKPEEITRPRSTHPTASTARPTKKAGR